MGRRPRNGQNPGANLLAAGFLATDEGSRAVPYLAVYPEAAAPGLFPGLYPAPQEQALRAALGVAN